MGIELLAHLGIPLLAGLIVIFLVASAGKERLSWDSCNDVALDLSILSIGATGGIFVSPALIKHWGNAAAVYSILVVLVDLLLGSLLVYQRRWRTTPVNISQGLGSLFLGCLAVAVTAGVLYLGMKD